MRLPVVACVLVMIFAAGCATTSAVRLGDTHVTRAPVPWEDVVVYREASQVPGDYDEIALLHSTGDWTWSNESTMYDSMRKKAGKLGANAIILDAMTEPSAGAKVASAIFGVGGAERKGKAIAIFVHPKADTTEAGSEP